MIRPTVERLVADPSLPELTVRDGVASEVCNPLLVEFERVLRGNSILHWNYDGTADKLRGLEASDERVERARRAFLAADQAERDRLAAENARLREALERIAVYVVHDIGDGTGKTSAQNVHSAARTALAASPVTSAEPV